MTCYQCESEMSVAEFEKSQKIFRTAEPLCLSCVRCARDAAAEAGEITEDEA